MSSTLWNNIFSTIKVGGVVSVSGNFAGGVGKTGFKEGFGGWGGGGGGGGRNKLMGVTPSLSTITDLQGRNVFVAESARPTPSKEALIIIVL